MLRTLMRQLLLLALLYSPQREISQRERDSERICNRFTDKLSTLFKSHCYISVTIQLFPSPHIGITLGRVDCYVIVTSQTKDLREK